uniref:Putative secreted protein n=1 Tax=Anopheles triannulatus TaxID=58253 RepID=A0A2M4B4E4_9DIPT
MLAAFLLFRHRCLGKMILRYIRTLRVSRTGLAASSRQQDRIVAGRFRALVLDVPALHPSNDASLFLERNTFAHDAVHHAERGAQIGEPGRMQLAYRLAKLTLCGPVAARSFVLDQQRMAAGGHGPWPSAATDQQQQRHRQRQPPPPPHHAHCRGDKFSHCFYVYVYVAVDVVVTGTIYSI